MQLAHEEYLGEPFAQVTMECNIEEAIRAKEIAEKKMQIKDFVGAKNVALQAHQLFSDLDNISQILTVCDVHCCAGVKVNGEMDWYSILQVEQTADESSIKKQYRKLALLLHPDKNKFAGAEAAFKLIGEAHMALSDRAKRTIYDMKRRANISRAVPKPPAQQPNMTTSARKQPAVQNNFPGTDPFHYGNMNQQQTSGSYTFWTTCPCCCMNSQYFRVLLNKSIRCHRCLTTFVASDSKKQAMLHHWENPAHLRNNSQTSMQEDLIKANHFGNSCRTGFQGNVTGGSSSGVNMAHGGVGSIGKQKEDGVGGGGSGEGTEIKPEKVNTKKAGDKERPGKPSAVNGCRKKGRKRVIESSDSDSSTEGDDGVSEDGVDGEDKNAGTSSGHYPRRSCRMKQNVTYNERGIVDDDDFVSPPRRVRKAGVSHGADLGRKSPGTVSGIPGNASNGQREGAFGESLQNGGESMKRDKVNETEAREEKEGNRSNADPAADSKSKASPEILSFSTPDSEFYDFEQERDASKFAVDQIWAVYDYSDAMPRYYVRIREIFSPFRLRFTWLEHTPLSKVEEVWTHEELPVACGNYRLGKSAFITELTMFSHIICWNNGTKQNTYDICPRKGEVWALFKGWDSGWSLDANSHRLYEYEVVEILSDISDGRDFLAVHLVKIEGFVSLFVRSTAGDGKMQIPPAEVLRFSHRVPSYRMAGGEREGVPKGSFELDTAALPIEFGKAFPSVSLESLDIASVKACSLDPDNSDSGNRSRAGEEKLTSSADKKTIIQEDVHDMENKWSKNLSPKRMNGFFHNANATTAECPVYSSMQPPSTISYEYLAIETDFHNFQEDRSIGKFQSGQIWALYSDIDEQPKYYAKIKKVNVKAVTVSVVWVELFPRGKDEEAWTRKQMPATCGRFKVKRKAATFDATDAFSHLVHAEPAGDSGDLYDIYPRSGAVWALYKDWNVGWTCSTLVACKYHVVEILEVSDSIVKVLLLSKVADYNAVFMPEMKGDVQHTMEIPLMENLRFSHQIPAFRLTSEVDDALQGYWELDSASVPHIHI